MKTQNKILLKNTISLYIMNIVKLLFPILTLPYLTRILTTNTYGVVVYVKSIIVYVQLIIDYGFLLSATKKITMIQGDKKEVGKIVGDTIIEKICLSLVALIIFIILTFTIPILANYKGFALLYFLSSAITIFILDFLYRGIEKMNLIAIPYVVSKTISTGLLFVCVKSDKNLILIAILEVIGNLFAAIVSMMLLKKENIFVSITNMKKWIYDIKESTVYFMSNFATTIFGALTTIIIGFYFHTNEIAYWGLCMQILSAVKALYNPITNSLYPYMIKSKNLKIINKINTIMLIPMIIGSIIVLIYSADVVKIIGGEKYIYAGSILKYLLPAFIFSFYSMIYGWPVLGAIDKNKETTKTTIFASISQIIGMFIIIYFKKFDLKYFAINCSISEMLLFLMRYIYYLKNKKSFNYSEVKK